MTSGVSYNGFENLEVSLGSGDDDFSVTGAASQPNFRVVSVLNAGPGDDEVTVDLQAGQDGFFALNAEAGDDSIDAATSTLPLILFGGDGQDTITGGLAGDTIFGDRGRVDYRDSQGTLVTRLGVGLAERNVLAPGAPDLTPLDVPLQQTDGGEYFAEVILTRDAQTGAGDTIHSGGGDDRVLGGLGGDLIQTAAGADIVLADHGEFNFVADGDPATLDHIVSRDTSVAGADIVSTGDDSDIVVAGPGDDQVVAGGADSATDYVIGDSGQVTFASDGTITDLRSIDDSLGGDDTLATGLGVDYIIAGGDDADASQTNDIVLAGSNANATNLAATLASIQGGDFDALDAGDGRTDYVIGDGGRITFDSLGAPLEMLTTSPSLGGPDTIVTGNGPDIVFGGKGDDRIFAGGDDQSGDLVVGDNGRRTFQDTGVFGPGERTSILSFNFHGDARDGDVTGVAGAAPARAGNWNNLEGRGDLFGDDGSELIEFDDGSMAADVTIRWGRDLDSDHPRRSQRGSSWRHPSG